MPMIPVAYCFEIKISPGSEVWEVCFYVQSQGATKYNYTVWHSGVVQDTGLTDRPFTMNAAMTILQEYFDNKK